MRWTTKRWGPLRDHVCRGSYPSGDPGVEFTTALTVRARIAPRRGQFPPDPLNLVGPKADPIIRDATHDRSALQRDTIQQTIAAQLADLTSLSTAQVDIHDVFLRITLDEAATARARELQRMRHELHLDQLARQQARSRAEFIRDECLADPATARIYALLEQSPRLGELSEVLRADLVTEVAQWHRHARPVLITQAVIDFFGRLTPDQACDVIERFTAMMRGYGAPEQANRLHNADATASPSSSRAATNGAAEETDIAPLNRRAP